MRRFLIVLTVTILVHNNLYAADADTHVFVREPMTILVRPFQLPRLCATGRDVMACTATLGQRLSCRCGLKNGAWAIDARAQFIPVMYVLGPERVLHEREHIGDLERALSAYVNALERQRFDSDDACQRISRAAMAEFSITMDQFKRDSNAARR